ncbi:MAG: hypothetical protein ACD_75C00843G0003 [uncultured bacterium]|nr:MAG: hypothetical protein ACD_75C00843G0003 [uncultured bacterium]
MKLICPSCGAIASAESWNNDTNCRETLLVISRLPAPLPKAALGYLSLFRPGQQSLTWKKALRLALEVEELTGKGFVHIQGRIDRDCPARIWAQAMEQMVERRGSLSLPLPNGHIYLSKVAYDLATETTRQTETKADAAKTYTRTRPADASLDPLEKARRDWDARNAGQADTIHLSSIPPIIKGMK